jgi:bacterioferritin-associated ferredoxin
MPETDRYSGQPDAKATPAAIAPVRFAYRGFALTRQPIALPANTWWARVAVANGHGLLLATNEGSEIWRGAARQTFTDDAELAEYADGQHGIYRVAAFADGQLIGCLFVGPAKSAPQWDAVKALFEAEALGDDARRVLLSGRSADGLVSAGPIVCACFSVGLATIRDAIQSGAATNVEAIGQALRAGTNCGSCPSSSGSWRMRAPRHRRSSDLRHSALMLAAWMIGPHFAISDLISLVTSAGAEVATVAPISASFCFMAGSASTPSASSRIFRTISVGVLAGANRAYQEDIS